MAGHDRAPGAYRGATVAVLGASGFIGRWVAHALIDAGATVVLVARDAEAVHPTLRTSAGASVLETDLSREQAVHDAIARAQPAIVFNLAGYGVDRGERDERAARTINTDLPRWIATSLADIPSATWRGLRVVHTGSALEYGEIGGDLAEDSAPNPTTLYGQTKLAGTLALRDVCIERGVPGLTARLFTVYGAGEHPGRLLPTLLEARGHRERVPLSAGTQRRDFTYVEDVAEGLLRLGVTVTAEPGEIVNVATGTLTEVRAFVTTAAQVLGIAPERLDFGAVPARAEEMQHEPVSVARLGALLGWRPATPVAEGVRRAAEHTDADRARGAS